MPALDVPFLFIGPAMPILKKTAVLPPSRKFVPAVVAYGVLALAPAWSLVSANEQTELFERHVRPQLVEHCTSCHGEDQQEGGLRLDSRQGLLEGGERGPAIVPGRAVESLLIQVLRHQKEDIEMPSEDEPLEPDVIDALARWVDQGATWPEDEPLLKVASSKPPFEEVRQSHWAFQPLPTNPPPAEGETAALSSPVDSFILARLKSAGLSPVGPADRRTLIRRATMDLIGLPPTQEEVEAFVADDSPDAYRQLIDRLLARPGYGEHWSRHWLDLVRYADTAGDASDYPVPEAYRYRNYVIDAFNRDLPYDAFIREQIAGDLLPFSDDDERWRQVVATGYLAMARRIGVSPHEKKHVMLEDAIDNLGKTFLGLTLGCARCHDHKIDPVSTKDYYAIYGILDSSIFPHAGAEHKQRRENFVYRLSPDKVATFLAPYREKLDPIQKKFDAASARRKELRDQPGTEAEQKKLDKLRIVYWNEYKKLVVTIPAMETAYAISEGKPHDAKLQQSGDPNQKREKVPRGFLEVLGGQQLPKGHPQSGRRELGEWIADAENPLTARVMVNRIWQHHFSRGLVASTSDFGILGQAPTHPELLDYLARYFIDHGWSIKAMHRLIMLSDTYQLSGSSTAENLASDPENLLLWRANRRRLSAEQYRDSVLMLSGMLDRTPGQRHPFPHQDTFRYRQHDPFQEDYPTNKRSIYVLQQRLRKVPFLDLFDGPDGNLALAERRATSTPLQSLYLMNSPFIHEQSQAIANRLSQHEEGDEDWIATAYGEIFGRPPTEEEILRSKEFLETTGEQIGQVDPDRPSVAEQARAAHVRSMLSSNAFLYID